MLSLQSLARHAKHGTAISSGATQSRRTRQHLESGRVGALVSFGRNHWAQLTGCFQFIAALFRRFENCCRVGVCGECLVSFCSDVRRGVVDESHSHFEVAILVRFRDYDGLRFGRKPTAHSLRLQRPWAQRRVIRPFNRNPVQHQDRSAWEPNFLQD